MADAEIACGRAQARSGSARSDAAGNRRDRRRRNFRDDRRRRGGIAGPGIVVSFIVSGFACAMAALCYAEFAAMIPVAGSAYSYSYATMGELVAWIIGWDLVLEYAVGAATVASGWSGYFGDSTSGPRDQSSVRVDACAAVDARRNHGSAGVADRVADNLRALHRHFRERAPQLDHCRDQVVRHRGRDRGRRILS